MNEYLVSSVNIKSNKAVVHTIYAECKHQVVRLFNDLTENECRIVKIKHIKSFKLPF